MTIVADRDLVEALLPAVLAAGRIEMSYLTAGVKVETKADATPVTAADHEAEVESFNTSIGECEKARVENLMGWMDCRVTLDTAQDSIVAEKKKGKASVWRGRKQGALWTAIIFGGLKLFGVL